MPNTTTLTLIRASSLSLTLIGALALQPAQALGPIGPIGLGGQGNASGLLQGRQLDAFGEARGAGRLALDGERLRQRGQQGRERVGGLLEKSREAGAGGQAAASGEGQTQLDRGAGALAATQTLGGSAAGALNAQRSPMPADPAPAAELAPPAPVTQEQAEKPPQARLDGEGQARASGPRGRQIEASAAGSGRATPQTAQAQGNASVRSDKGR